MSCQHEHQIETNAFIVRKGNEIMVNQVETTSCLDELIALRPSDGATSEDIKAAIEAIQAKGVEYQRRADALRVDRPRGLLTLPGKRIRAIDEEIALLEIGVEQAVAIIPPLEEQLKLKAATECKDRLIADREKLAHLPEEHSKRFQEFWVRVTAEYVELLKQNNKIASDCKVFNQALDAATADHGRMDVRSICGNDISRFYYDHVCLPKAGIDVSERLNVGYVRKGDCIKIDDLHLDACRGSYYAAEARRSYEPPVYRDNPGGFSPPNSVSR